MTSFCSKNFDFNCVPFEKKKKERKMYKKVTFKFYTYSKKVIKIKVTLIQLNCINYLDDCKQRLTQKKKLREMGYTYKIMTTGIWWTQRKSNHTKEIFNYMIVLPLGEISSSYSLRYDKRILKKRSKNSLCHIWVIIPSEIKLKKKKKGGCRSRTTRHILLTEARK